MSNTRHTGDGIEPVNTAIVTSWFPLLAGHSFARHDHPDHQLVWASQGVVMVTIDDRTWVLPRNRALWIPAAIPHTTSASSHSLLAGIYFPTATSPLAWAEPTVLAVTELLAELLIHLADDPPTREHAEALVFELLEPVTITTLHLPMPVDDRARRVAELLQADVRDPRSLAQWGEHVGASDRTLTRAFTHDTGMTFAAWRTQLRISAALPLLADGASVATAARAVGYANPSAFIVAFRRSLGTSPAAYFGRAG